MAFDLQAMLAALAGAGANTVNAANGRPMQPFAAPQSTNKWFIRDTPKAGTLATHPHANPVNAHGPTEESYGGNRVPRMTPATPQLANTDPQIRYREQDHSKPMNVIDSLMPPRSTPAVEMGWGNNQQPNSILSGMDMGQFTQGMRALQQKTADDDISAKTRNYLDSLGRNGQRHSFSDAADDAAFGSTPHFSRLGGFRASGGAIMPGKKYIVGENGPEEIETDAPAYIRSNKATIQDVLEQIAAEDNGNNAAFEKYASMGSPSTAPVRANNGLTPPTGRIIDDSGGSYVPDGQLNRSVLQESAQTGLEVPTPQQTLSPLDGVENRYQNAATEDPKALNTGKGKMWKDVGIIAAQIFSNMMNPKNQVPIQGWGAQRKQLHVGKAARELAPLREQYEAEQTRRLRDTQIQTIVNDDKRADKVAADNTAYRTEQIARQKERDAAVAAANAVKTKVGYTRYQNAQKQKRGGLTSKIAEMSTEIGAAEGRLAKAQAELAAAARNPKGNKARIGQLQSQITREAQAIADKKGNIERHKGELESIIDLTPDEWGIVGEESSAAESGPIMAAVKPSLVTGNSSTVSESVFMERLKANGITDPTEQKALIAKARIDGKIK